MRFSSALVVDFVSLAAVAVVFAGVFVAASFAVLDAAACAAG
jgi:hypothetical protein